MCYFILSYNNSGIIFINDSFKNFLLVIDKVEFNRSSKEYISCKITDKLSVIDRSPADFLIVPCERRVSQHRANDKYFSIPILLVFCVAKGTKYRIYFYISMEFLHI